MDKTAVSKSTDSEYSLLFSLQYAAFIKIETCIRSFSSSICGVVEKVEVYCWLLSLFNASEYLTAAPWYSLDTSNLSALLSRVKADSLLLKLKPEVVEGSRPCNGWVYSAWMLYSSGRLTSSNSNTNWTNIHYPNNYLKLISNLDWSWHTKSKS